MVGTVEKRYQDDNYLVKYKLLNSDDSTKANFPKGKNVNVKEN